MVRLVAEPSGELEDVVRGTAASPLEGDCRVIRGWFQRKRYDCGHRDAARFHFVIWGFTVRLHREFLLANGLCPECLLRRLRDQIIRCADCGEPILPGAPIAMPCRDYRDRDDARLTIIRWVRGELVVTCLCDDNALGFSGYWDGEHIRRLRWTTVPER